MQPAKYLVDLPMMTASRSPRRGVWECVVRNAEMREEGESAEQRQGRTNADLDLRCLRFRQHKRVFYSTVLTAEQLSRWTEVPRYNPVTKEGYQRDANERRATKAAEYVLNGGVFPGAVILSLRQEDRTNVHVNVVRQHAGYDEVEMVIPTGVRLLKLVDGQHRDRALGIAKDRRSDFPSEGFGLATVVIESMGEIDEARLFRTIHEEQKNVPTDLTNRILQREVEEGHLSPEALLETGQKAKYRNYVAVKVMDALANDPDSPWRGLIRPANPGQLPPLADGEEPAWAVTETSMATSLKEFIRYMQLAPVERTAGIVKKYWRAVALECKDAWEDPDEHPYLQKTPGIYILNMLLPSIYERVRGNGEVTEDSFRDVLIDLGVDSGLFGADGRLRGIGGIGGFKTVVDELEAKLVRSTAEA